MRPDNIAHAIDIKPRLPLPFLQIAQERRVGQQDVFDIGEDDRLGLLVQRVEQARVEDLDDELQVAVVRRFGRDELEDGLGSAAVGTG
jgi:hypothetical protein